MGLVGGWGIEITSSGLPLVERIRGNHSAGSQHERTRSVFKLGRAGNDRARGGHGASYPADCHFERQREIRLAQEKISRSPPSGGLEMTKTDYCG
jgi:hypothetical protein